MVRGRVESWSDDVDWGVLVSPEVPERSSRYETLEPDAEVVFEYHTPGQDGCEYGADWVRLADPALDGC